MGVESPFLCLPHQGMLIGLIVTYDDTLGKLENKKDGKDQKTIQIRTTNKNHT